MFYVTPPGRDIRCYTGRNAQMFLFTSVRRQKESQREPRLLSQLSLTSSSLCLFFKQGAIYPMNWFATSWLSACRKEWGWRVVPMSLILVSTSSVCWLSSGCQAILHQSERLHVAYCPLLVSPMLYHTMITGLETDDRWQFIFLTIIIVFSLLMVLQLFFVLLCVFIFLWFWPNLCIIFPGFILFFL